MKFEIYRAGMLHRQWRWRLRAKNGEIIANGESYWRRGSCMRAINLVAQSADATVKELD